MNGFSPAAVDAMLKHRWPGNVRELRNALASVAATGTLPDDLQTGHDGASRSGEPVDTDSSFREAKKRVVDAFEHDSGVATPVQDVEHVAM